MQFYLVAPLLAGLYFRRTKALRRIVLILAIIAGIGIAWVFGAEYRVWTSLLGNIHFFLIGFLFADLYATNQLFGAQSNIFWDCAAILSVAAVIASDSSIAIVTLPIAIILGFFAAFRGFLTAKVLQLPWIVAVGGMCYTIYLYHVVLISVFIKFTARVHLSSPSADMLLRH